MVTDLNWSISPGDFINWAAFLANLGLINISSQPILPNATFLLSSSYIISLFRVCRRHSTSKCLADCIPLLQGHFGESKPGTFLKCRNFLRPIFSFLIWTMRALAALQRPYVSLVSSLWSLGRLHIALSPFSHLSRSFPTAPKCFVLMPA